MNRNEAITAIKSIEPAIRAKGVASLYLFGSTSRDEATSASDVDVFIDRNPAQHFGLSELVALKDLLTDTLGIPVDVGTRTGLHPRLKADIERSATQVF